MAYRHYIWDFDGTLYDTYGLMTDIWRQVLAHYGVSAPDADILRLAKRKGRDVLTAYCPDRDPKEGFSLYHQYGREAGISRMRLYAGAERFLRRTISAGAQHYLYTHRDNAALDALKRDGLYPLFTDFITSQDGFPSKPAPDALNHLIGRHMLNRSACVMVGDRALDMQAAQNAGIDGVLFDPDGFYPDCPARHRFEDFGAMLALLIPQPVTAQT